MNYILFAIALPKHGPALKFNLFRALLNKVKLWRVTKLRARRIYLTFENSDPLFRILFVMACAFLTCG